MNTIIEILKVKNGYIVKPIRHNTMSTLGELPEIVLVLSASQDLPKTLGDACLEVMKGEQ